MNVIGEIVQAFDFTEADNMYIKYEFMIPPWFQLDYEEILEIHYDDDKKMEEMMEDWNKTYQIYNFIYINIQILYTNFSNNKKVFSNPSNSINNGKRRRRKQKISSQFLLPLRPSTPSR